MRCATVYRRSVSSLWTPETIPVGRSAFWLTSVLVGLLAQPAGQWGIPYLPLWQLLYASPISVCWRLSAMVVL